MDHVANYQLEDFLRDTGFHDWVRKGAFQNADAPWSLWLEKHPGKKVLALRAREILLASRLDESSFPENYFAEIEKHVLAKVSKQKNRHVVFTYGIAASFALLLAAGGWFLSNRVMDTSESGLSVPSVPFYENRVPLTAENRTSVITPVALPDGSSVLLHPDSRLVYHDDKNGIRRVELTGKAFFEVARKGKDEPFKVIAGEMVTQVLGTSFTVTAFEKDQRFSVIVKTGEVAVTTISGESGKQPGITLKPNQQVSFSRENAHFIKGAVSQKEISDHAPATSASYVFDDTPAVEVFKRIGAEYGLDIVMDEKLLADCGLTTNLTSEPLFQKLGIICNSIGPTTHFTINDSRIHIFSEGCNQ